MEFGEKYQWLIHSNRCRLLLVAFRQPTTAQQFSRQTTLSLDSCSVALRQLALKHLVICLNELSRRSRLYWLTKRGQLCQQQLRAKEGLPAIVYDFPSVDWTAGPLSRAGYPVTCA